MAGKEGQLDVVGVMVNDQFKPFSINLNVQHVNGMTPFDLSLHMYGYQILQSRSSFLPRSSLSFPSSSQSESHPYSLHSTYEYVVLRRRKVWEEEGFS